MFWFHESREQMKMLTKRVFLVVHETSAHETSFFFAHEMIAHETNAHETSFFGCSRNECSRNECSRNEFELVRKSRLEIRFDFYFFVVESRTDLRAVSQFFLNTYSVFMPFKKIS